MFDVEHYLSRDHSSFDDGLFQESDFINENQNYNLCDRKHNTIRKVSYKVFTSVKRSIIDNQKLIKKK